MKSERVNEMFQKHLNPEDSLLYPDFLNDLCKRIVRSFILYSVMINEVIVIINKLQFKANFNLGFRVPRQGEFLFNVGCSVLQVDVG